MRAINGVMTRQSPSLASAGTWKVMDFPPPVGISPKVSRPSVMLLMISSWIPRKVSYPQYCFRSLTPNPSAIRGEQSRREGSFEVTIAVHGLIKLLAIPIVGVSKYS